jgi:F-type H+-transporting ATPase subunit delta
VHPSIVSRNYAETLMALAERHGGIATAEQYLAALDEVALLLEREPRIRAFIATPRVDAEAKKQALRSALAGRVPELFLRFLMVVVDKRRHTLIREIAVAFHEMVDRRLGRVRVDVAVAHEPDDATRDQIRLSLERKLGTAVLPRFTVDPSIIGGVVVRVGDQVMDGSIRRRVQELRRRMIGAELPHPVAAG